MASIGFLIGGALVNALAFTGSNYLFSSLSKESIDPPSTDRIGLNNFIFVDRETHSKKELMIFGHFTNVAGCTYIFVLVHKISAKLNSPQE